jgi:chromosome segregation ATPase
MPNPDPDTIKAAGSYLELLVGGGATSMLAALFLYNKYWVMPKREELLRDIKTTAGAIKHERDERKKLDPRFTTLQNEIHAEKAVFVEFMNWYEKFKNDTESSIKRVEEREHEHYLEARDMKNEDKLIQQDLNFVKDKVARLETSMTSLTVSIEDLKNLLIKTIAKAP